MDGGRTTTPPPTLGPLCRGRLDSRGGCHLVTSGGRARGECLESAHLGGRMPRLLQDAKRSSLGPRPLCCLPLEQWPWQGRSRAERCRPPTTPEGHQQVAAAREPRGRSAVTSALPPGRSSLGRTGGSVTGRNAPQERSRPSLVRPAPPAGRAEGRGGHRRSEGGGRGSSVCGRGSLPVLRARPGSLSMVLSFGVLRRLPLCRCECASRPGWAVGGPEGARGRHVRPGIPRVRLSSALSPRKGLRKRGLGRGGLGAA